MVNLRACASAVDVLMSAAASPVGLPCVVAPINAPAASQDETIYRPEAPTDDASSGRIACRITDNGRGWR